MLDKRVQNTHWINASYCDNSSGENDIHKEKNEFNSIPFNLDKDQFKNRPRAWMSDWKIKNVWSRTKEKH